MSDTSFTARSTQILASWLQRINDKVWKGRNPIYVTSSGSANAYVLTLPSVSLYSSLTAGDEFTFKAHAANTSSATLQLVGASPLSAKDLYLGIWPLTGGEIQIGDIVQVAYDGTRFQITGGAPYRRFVQSGSDALSESVQTAVRRVVWASQYGSGFTTTPGADIAKAITALGANGGIVELPPGSCTLEAQVSLPSKIIIRGRGIGVTTLTAKNSLNAHAFVNSDSTNGNSNIELLDFTYDGNYTNQTSGNGVTITKGTYCYVEIETKNCYGHGQIFSGGSNNRFGPKNISRSNGKSAAGYGLYIFNSDDNQVAGDGIYDDNCIGVAVEASGASATAKRNKVGPVKARNNRADFSQSGAGVHWEDSSGGDADDGELIGPICTGSTGVGINNTGTNLHISGGTVEGNSKSGVVSSAAVGFLYSGIQMLDNGASDTAGYRAQMRFDDSALNPASSGLVAGCKGSGTENGLLTLSTNSAVKVAECQFSGTTADYSLASTSDAVVGFDAGGRWIKKNNPSFQARLVSATVAATAVIVFESELFDTTGNYNTSTGVFTAPCAGMYLFCVNVGANDGNRINWELRKNSTAILQGSAEPTAAADTIVSGSIVLSLAKDDTVDVNLLLGTARNNAETTNFTGYLLG